MKKRLKHSLVTGCARVLFGGILSAVGFTIGSDVMNAIFPPQA